MDPSDELGRVSAAAGETTNHAMQLLSIELAEAKHGRYSRHALLESTKSLRRNPLFLCDTTKGRDWGLRLSLRMLLDSSTKLLK